MAIEFARATTAAEVEAVQRLRYAVYVEEMHRYDSALGAAEGLFAEPEDETGLLFFARDGDQVVAATRLSWGGDGFSSRQIDQYQLKPFLAELPAEVIGVGERATVLPTHRGTGVLDELIEHGKAMIDRPVHVVFGCCEPHLLSLYLKMGQRTYARHNINSPTAGYLIPIIGFLPDAEALRGIGDATPPGEFAPCIAAVLGQDGRVRSEILSSPGEQWHEVRRILDELDAQRYSIFDGLTEHEAERCIAHSTIIDCDAGDRVLKRGGTARNIFVVLSGTLEVRDGDRIVAVLRAGDAFGELAFLLERTRTADVDAADDDTRILSLSERALRTMIDHEPTIAAKLLLNLAKMLCVRIIRTSGPNTG